MSRAGSLLVPGASPQRSRDRALGRELWIPRLLTDGASLTASSRPLISPAGGTPGAWSQIVAALSEDVGYVRIRIGSGNGSSASNSSTLLDLGVGGAGSEVVVLDSLGVGYTGYRQLAPTTPSGHSGWLFPLWIPKGSRVACRLRTGVVTTVGFEFYAPIHGLKPGSVVTALGADTANRKGVTLTVPGAANTKGAWTQIIAATAEPYEALGISIQGGADTALTSGNYLIDIAKGAAGAEQIVIPDLEGDVDGSNEKIYMHTPLVHPCSIPKGTRLAARYASESTGNSFDVILHGIRAAA